MNKKKYELIEAIEAYSSAKKSENSLLINFATEFLTKKINDIFDDAKNIPGES